MKAGDEINCPHCKEQSFLVKKTVMDGWVKIGEILVCSTCHGKISDVEREDKTKETKENVSINKLASFLNTQQETKKKLEDEDGTFCRDCKHFISHPFLNRCSLLEKNINPMDDCMHFEKKK